MAKKIFVFILFLGVSTIQAQDFRWNDFSIYYQGSAFNSMIMNPNHYETEEVEVYQPTIRFGGGLGLMYNFSDRFSISTGVDYDRKGTKFKEYKRGNYVERDYKLDYISANLMMRYMLNRFTIGVGGYYSYLINEDLRFVNDVELGTERFLNDGRFFQDDVGVTVEIGYLMDFDYRTKGNISLFASYGLMEINNNRYQQNHFGPTYNQSTNFVAGIRLTVFILTQPY